MSLFFRIYAMQRRILLPKDLSLTRDLSGEKVSHIYTMVEVL